MANIRVIITNKGTFEFQSDRMSFKLIKLMNDELNGNLYALKIQNRIDREHIDYYDLTINTNLNEEIKLRICLIDVNDNTPVFKLNNLSFNLKENHIYTQFGQVQVIDEDIGRNGQLTFELVDLNMTSLFTINKINGYLSVNSMLDRELCDYYRLNIRVCDMGETRLCNTTFVSINVLDENDNVPKFDHKLNYSFKLREFKAPYTFIANIKAVDLDLQSMTNYIFEPLNMSNLFFIDSINGDLYAKETFKNVNETFKFSVYANDAKRDDLQMDSIHVQVVISGLSDDDPFIEYKIKNKTLISLDLNYLKSTTRNRNIELTRLNEGFLHKYEFLFIRRMSMKFLNDIDVNMSNYDILNENSNNLKNNLSNIFKIDSNGSLSLNQISPRELNTGFYNFSIRIRTANNRPLIYKSVKLFVYNSSDLSLLNETVLCDLSDYVDLWHDLNVNKNWLFDYEMKYLNGTYTLDNDYYENISMINELVNSYLVTTKQHDHNLTMLINSNAIIMLICVFLIIAIMLISIITYKHYKATLLVNNGDEDDHHGSDVDCGFNEKSKDLEKFVTAVKVKNIDDLYESKSSSTSVSLNSSNKLLYSTVTKETIATSSSTTTTTSITTNNEQANRISTSSVTSSEDLKNNKNEIHLIEIQRKSLLAVTNINEIDCGSKTKKHIKFEDDFGYYGSSDYSDNNSLTNKRVSMKQTNENASHSSTAASSPSFHTCPKTQPTISTTTVSTTMSSNFDDFHQQNKNSISSPYNENVKNENDKANIKTYFERFERIYNSHDFSINNNNNNDIDGLQKNQLNYYTNRNSIAAYSYV